MILASMEAMENIGGMHRDSTELCCLMLPYHRHVLLTILLAVEMMTMLPART
jgi:hypothetical protein